MVASSANETGDSSFCRSSCKVKCSSEGTSDDKATTSKQFRKVQFLSRVYCRRFSTRTLASEKEDRWYSPNEMRKHRQRDRNFQTMMGDGDASLWGEADTDGLKTVKETKLRRRLVKEAQASVFVEQACQEKLFLSKVQDNDLEVQIYLNEERIAEVYTSYSKKAALVAYMRGMQTSQNEALQSLPTLPSKNKKSVLRSAGILFSALPEESRLRRGLAHRRGTDS